MWSLRVIWTSGKPLVSQPAQASALRFDDELNSPLSRRGDPFGRCLTLIITFSRAIASRRRYSDRSRRSEGSSKCAAPDWGALRREHRVSRPFQAFGQCHILLFCRNDRRATCLAKRAATRVFLRVSYYWNS